MTQTNSKNYNHQVSEEKWLAKWEELGLFQDQAKLGSNPHNKEKLYLLFAFAYPSGSGLHVGHVESKTALDILARYNRMNNKHVFFPVGWDAFGLPAENYAIKTGVHPAQTTKYAIHTFRRQIKRIGISYDWANEIATSHPEYYKWTQWLFLELYNKGLAYKKPGMVNWCPSCQTVLANEQVVQKNKSETQKVSNLEFRDSSLNESTSNTVGVCERCDTPVIQRSLEQWYFKITDYKDELIDDLDQVDWPKATEEQQRNWIGRSHGAKLRFKITSYAKATKVKKASDVSQDSKFLEVFTTAHDTIYGVTFMVVAPEHDILTKYKDQISNWDQIQAYIEESSHKTDLDRQIQKEKTGVKLEGIEAINPINNKSVPIFVADYVLSSYGTGAIMAVPGHDERDHEFATKYNLPIIKTYQKIQTEPQQDLYNYTQIKQSPLDFELINSADFNGQKVAQARQSILDKLVAQEAGTVETQYKLRDWLISRQRYWGAPIPIVYDPNGKAHPVKEEDLPWLLPTDVEFKPTGESPLRDSKELHQRVEKLYGKGWTPEYDTMDTFVDSSWYFLRYVDSRNNQEFATQEQIKAWLPVDFYMIGPEHIVLHLLYARFFTKFLRDQGYLDFDEPFMTMRHQGMILGPDNRKMSKSKGNVIDPDLVIKEHGADALRVYEMFMGPIEADKPWNDRSVVGVKRFLERVYRLVKELKSEGVNGEESYQHVNSSTHLHRKLHQTIKKVSEDITNLKFNTAIAAMMEFVNAWEAEYKEQGTRNKEQEKASTPLSREDQISFVKILAPFAPFIAEDLYQKLAHQTESANFESVHQTVWPVWSPDLVVENMATVVIQVNGKLRDSFEIELDTASDEDAVVSLAQNREKILPWLADSTLIKVIFIPAVPGKNCMVNFVVKPN